jgi:hypothetical protein
MLRVFLPALLLCVSCRQAKPAEPCLSQCELAGGCGQIPFDEHPPFSTFKAQVRAKCEPFRAAAGTCETGLRFVYLDHSNWAYVHYFDTRGRFVGLASWTDMVDETCQGEAYWPRPVACPNPVVSQTLCGEPIQADELFLPWQDGKRPSRSASLE